MNKPIIAITALATGGKDFTCKLLIEEFAKRGIRAKRFALADSLKEEMKFFFLSSFGVDIFKADGEFKSIIRGILVEFGRAKRILSKGTYWTSKLSEKLDLEKDTYDVAVITDLRYCGQYDFDETDWAKSKDAVIVHLTRILDDGTELQPPNADEAENDPKIKAIADYKLVFKNIVGNEENKKQALSDIHNLVDELTKKWNL